MTAAKAYHHGDLRDALVRAALEILEDSTVTEVSVRAAARRAGVSTGAPYRHFADRDALLSAVAAVGYRELAGALVAAHPAPKTADDLADIAVAYVQFALTRPGLFRVMFAEGCDRVDPDRVAAVAAITEYVKAIAQQVVPTVDSEPLTTAMWALVHGLAFLHMDGKFDSSSTADVAHRVRTAVSAIVALQITEAGANQDSTRH
jgi:AcrR family transcriptional regulator